MINNKKIFFGIKIIIVLFVLLIIPGTGGCSINAIVRETYAGISSPRLRDVSIDEMEVESIKTLKRKMENNYDINQSISTIADELNNPFKPFFIEEEEDTAEKNILILESIYTKDNESYCEIKFNDHLYLLIEEAIFNDIYKIQSINDGSVIILKGDEVLTLFIGEMLYD